jgi:heat shock protein HtpX
MIRPMTSRADRVFRVSYRVQAAGVISLLAVPVILAAIALLLVAVSPWLAVIVGFAFFVGAQAAIARRWTSFRPKPVSPHDAPQIHAIVERLCATGNLAKPPIFLVDMRYANSWISGLTSKRTKLHLTSLLVELLDERQLEAVIAHELSHVGQKDSALMSAVGGPVAAMLDSASLYFHMPVAAWHAEQAARKARREPGDAATAATDVLDGLTQVWIYWLLLLPIGLLFVVVGGICRVTTALFSRARELEADAGAAQLTGNPAALASALITLSETPHGTVPLVDLRRAASLDVFHIVAIGKEYPLAHTHPTLHRRLKQLSDIETRLQHPNAV